MCNVIWIDEHIAVGSLRANREKKHRMMVINELVAFKAMDNG